MSLPPEFGSSVHSLGMASGATDNRADVVAYILVKLAHMSKKDVSFLVTNYRKKGKNKHRARPKKVASYRCNPEGHHSHGCRKRVCSRCRSKGHSAENCPRAPTAVHALAPAPVPAPAPAAAVTDGRVAPDSSNAMFDTFVEQYTLTVASGKEIVGSRCGVPVPGLNKNACRIKCVGLMSHFGLNRLGRRVNLCYLRELQIRGAADM